MPVVFLSYSTKDFFFAELAGIKLAEAGITLWRDQRSLVAGGDWRNGIERGISESMAVLVALSQDSTDSPYVTFEWAYGLGNGKTIVPLRLSACKVHPRLEPIQYFDFSLPDSQPWNLLIARINEIVDEATAQDELEPISPNVSAEQEAIVSSILAYLNQRGFQKVSFLKIRERINPNWNDGFLDTIVDSNPAIFKHATLKGELPGLKKLIP